MNETKPSTRDRAERPVEKPLRLDRTTVGSLSVRSGIRGGGWHDDTLSSDPRPTRLERTTR